MSNLTEIMSSLISTGSSNSKKEILAEIFTRSDDYSTFIRGIRYAFDPFNTFGIKKIEEKSDDGATGFDPEEFFGLCHDLQTRQLTGNAARDAVESFKVRANFLEWNLFYRRVLLKDMRCGITINTWNKVGGDELKVPIFSCQLAQDGKKVKNAFTGKKQIEVKLDGVRVISIIHPGGKVEMYSRNGKPLTNFTKIQQQLSALNPTVPMVLDGEIMSSSFQDLMKQLNRKTDVQSDDAVLNLFDMLPLCEFKTGKSIYTQTERSERLVAALENYIFDNVRTVDFVEVDFDTDEGRKEFKRLNKAALDGGYEGLMIKDLNGLYETKRSRSWLKMKPVIEVSLTVVALEEGEGKYKGMLGAMVCEGVDDGCNIKVNVGSGLTDEQRKDIWMSPKNVIGQIVEINADAITQNENGTYSLRFPRFKTFRGLLAGEKL